ncbi:tRNA (cytidine(34)-2'-O)-methyltransferase [uncultured Caulobacter sp.]|uniref:tRNA (cytidine(34)-2'-O)-methyltransferase n=1 Tax=uncultured Caulobacter sp. TaxID=158749 RepID=UPI00261AD061|nr:tRNA (cytidine(34)-2'-O)-methyltransferase [uncultured Caulobacter sp.]
MRIALFQPGIPQNVGAAIRLSACFDVGLDVIEPCSFPLDDKSLKRAALDYGPLARLKRHDGWEAFLKAPERTEGRLLLFTTKGATAFHRFAFAPGDTLLFGNESRGAPEEVHAAAQGRLVIPIAPDARSMNLATTAAMALGEALRQTNGFPGAA